MRKTDKINPTKYSGLFVAGVAFIALIGVVPAAQAGHLGNGGQQRIQAAVNGCLAMPHDKMMKDQNCKSQMALHPELFPAGSMASKNPPSP
jgi:hypothetical protein